MPIDTVHCELEHCVNSNVLLYVSAILPPGKLAFTTERLDGLAANYLAPIYLAIVWRAE